MQKNMQGHDDLLTGEKQTREAWTRNIESYDEIPEIYRGAFNRLVPDHTQFPYTLLAPSLVKSLDRTTEKLIIDARGLLYVLEWNGSQVVEHSYPYQSIFSIELGNVLLSSWLTMYGLDGGGAASVLTIDFNTSTFPFYATLVDKIRLAKTGQSRTEFETEKDKFDYLSQSSFKLMNYGRESLICGERVIRILLQTEIKQPRWAILENRFERTVSPAHLTVLTDLELILIQDVSHERKASHAKYGGVWQYIPLRSIKAVAWHESENGWLTLLVTISPDKTIEKLFDPCHRNEIEQLCAEIQEIRGETEVIA